MTVKHLACWDCDYFTQAGLGRCPKHASEDEKRAAYEVIDRQLADLCDVQKMINAEKSR
jgi:RNA polymerase subunit RPABC4/transcription elongation factor Spt4